VQRAPKNQVARVALADLMFDAKRYDDAAVHYTEASKAEPAVAKFPYRLGLIAENQKKTAEARAFFTSASSSPDAQLEMHAALARLCLSAKDMVCTRQALDRVPAASADLPVRRMRLELEYRTDHWAEVWKQANDLFLLADPTAQQLTWAADAANKLNKLDDEVNMLERAVRLAPEDLDLRYRLASIYADEQSLGKSDRAVALMVEFNTLYSGNGKSHVMLAHMYRKSHNLEGAKYEFQRGFELLPKPVASEFAWAFTSYGIALAEDGKTDDAFSNFQRATQLDPASANAWSNFATYCLQLGRTEELMAARTKLLTLDANEAAKLDDRMREAGLAIAQ
jgi:tetratricopeptide (TPR) repeat protein